MPGVSKIVYKGKTIIFVDYRGCTDENEMISLFRQAVEIITGYSEGVRVLIDFEGAFQTPNYLREARTLTKITQPYIIKRAIVGMNHPRRLILLNALNKLLGDRPIRPFKTIEEAKEWLVS